MKLVVASNNQKKRAEISNILGSLGIDLVAVEDTVCVDVVEDASTFSGNARKKAEAFAAANGLPALADDSGLCVEALNDAPGIWSARFAGAVATDTDNNRKLLVMLEGCEQRAAYFICALYLAFPDHKQPFTAEGRVEGYILEQQSGSHGFGYDPLFFCPELDKAFAEATTAEKASVSHRGRALRALAEQVKNHV